MSERARYLLYVSCGFLLGAVGLIMVLQGWPGWLARVLCLIGGGLVGRNYAMLEYLLERHPEAG